MGNIARKYRFALGLALVCGVLAFSQQEGRKPNSFEQYCEIVPGSPIFREPSDGRNPDEYKSLLIRYSKPGERFPRNATYYQGEEYAMREDDKNGYPVTLVGDEYIGHLKWGFTPKIYLGRCGYELR